MSRPDGLPRVVIVGRPNVGKSTLFNAITGQRRAIVGDEPGITRDRIHGDAVHRGKRFELVDTGGIIVDDREYIPREVLRQARMALEGAAHIIFIIDGRTEITAADLDLARMLRQLGRPVSLAVNKIDAGAREVLAHEFFELGVPDLFPVSAEHRLGLEELLDHVTSGFSRDEGSGEAPEARRIRVAIIGRPNVGKSTLLNALVGRERAIVSPVAGTTRDAVDEPVVMGDAEYIFVDTAGIRRKGKTKLVAEKVSVVMARRHIRLADVVLLLVEGPAGIVALDATIAGYAHDEGRAIVICVNKWDLVGEVGRRKFEEQVRDNLKFLEYAPVAFLSATEGTGVRKLFRLIREVYDNASRRVATGELNRFLEGVSFDRKQKIRYITQTGIRPPTFVLFTNRPEKLHFSTERMLVNQLRQTYGFRGTPVVIKTKHSRRD